MSKWVFQFQKDRYEQHPLPMKNSSKNKKQARGPDQDCHYIYKFRNNHQHHPQKLTPEEKEDAPRSFRENGGNHRRLAQ
ncbi:hypothetical protein DPMN_121799 [Dreissena polymorpha]|uniref:Uncharacterized protein n=1 Tax=Dreissena polymorpha TaxID=45954 RepID=A0A9D4JPS6_DREPO|nr:hypothetical protein DPMN_121799 [Dreissena polymorpha]